MLIGRVVGDLTATQKHASHEGQKLLLVQPLELDQTTPRGNPVLAVDAVSAGVGNLVLLVQDGYAAMTSINRPQSPIDMAVIGVVDAVDLVDGLGGGGGGVVAPPVAAKKGNKKTRA
jgi:ethanolamine utilization protein EutN